jgi:hypothetical protein
MATGFRGFIMRTLIKIVGVLTAHVTSNVSSNGINNAKRTQDVINVLNIVLA